LLQLKPEMIDPSPGKAHGPAPAARPLRSRLVRIEEHLSSQPANSVAEVALPPPEGLAGGLAARRWRKEQIREALKQGLGGRGVLRDLRILRGLDLIGGAASRMT
jgi:hypothetical protein